MSEACVVAEGDIVAATATCFLGFDPWTAFDCLRQLGIRYVEVPALPARWRGGEDTHHAEPGVHDRLRVSGMRKTPGVTGKLFEFVPPVA